MTGQSHLEQDHFSLLFNQYKSRLYAYLLAITHSPYSAEELTQEIFIKIWLRRHSLGSIENMEAYIFTIARNKSINYFRKAALDKRLASEIRQRMQLAENNTEDESLNADYKKSLQHGLSLLSPQRRIVYQLSRNEGLNHQQIASQLQLSRNTVKNHLTEALKFLRKYLTSRHTLFFLFFSHYIF